MGSANHGGVEPPHLPTALDSESWAGRAPTEACFHGDEGAAPTAGLVTHLSNVCLGSLREACLPTFCFGFRNPDGDAAMATTVIVLGEILE